MQSAFKVFIDFDGTITKIDVGENLFREFGNKEKVDRVIEQLLSDEISARECWIELCNSVADFDRKDFDSFIDNVEIDRTFHPFIDFCKENNMEMFVLSDGFDYYIDKILRRENLDELKVFSNELIFTDDNTLAPSFPHYAADCRSSANCKRNHIIENSGDDEYTVFIGDGNSDKETVQICDFIFAKDGLLKFCEKEKITYYPFRNFNDVKEKLESLLSKKKLKKRHQAELKRREIYIQE